MASLAERVARRIDPDVAESAFLRSLEANLVKVNRGHLIARDGERSHHAFVLKARLGNEPHSVPGWLIPGPTTAFSRRPIGNAEPIDAALHGGH